MINELMRRRALLMARQLPYDAEIEYLESNSDAYINTLISGGNDSLEIGIEFRYTSHINYATVLSNWISDSNRSTRLILNNDAGSLLGNIDNNSVNILRGFQLGENLVATLTSEYFTINGRRVTCGDSKLAVNNENIYLFNRPSPTHRDIGLQIYNCRISANGVALRDFIPVRVGQVGYMYDKVSGQLFGNAGTGDFVLGADV